MRDDAGYTSYQRLSSLVPAHQTVLDIACGAGGLLSLLDDTSGPRSRIGVDLSVSELQLAAALNPSANFTCARAQSLPFVDRSVDVVLCHMALMLMDDPAGVLEESRRVLRPGGVFGAVTNSPTMPDIVVKAVLGALRGALRSGDVTRHPPALGDPRTQSAGELSKLVGSFFSDVVTETFTVQQDVPREALWSFMVQSIYGLDAISDDEGESILSGLALPAVVTWTVPMVQIHARLPASEHRRS